MARLLARMPAADGASLAVVATTKEYWQDP